MSLADLNARVKADLERLAYGDATWVLPRSHLDGHVYDVVIVGGGQCGLGAAFGLLRERISNFLVIDENTAGGEGPWDTYARMITLRSSKHLTGIDMGVPSLTFRAFWEAQHGAKGWEALDKIARQDWMAYLRWFRERLDLPVRNETRLTLLEPYDGLFRLHLDSLKGEGGQYLLARKVILATGIQGGGEWHVPPMITQALPRALYAHTSEMIDFAALAGKRVAILGGGASGFDNAQYALTAGVAEAHVFMRRSELPRVNPIRHMEASGIIDRFAILSDADKYAVMATFFRHNQPPTNDTFDRARALPGFHLHLGAPWLAVAERDGQAVVTTPQGEHVFDFLILSTGLVTDPALRPELRLIESGILRWRNAFVPPPELANPLIDAHPYIGDDFAYLGRDPEAQKVVGGVFPFNYSALINFGVSAAALSGLKQALPKLVKGVADALFLDDRAAMLEAYFTYDEPEFIGQWPQATSTTLSPHGLDPTRAIPITAASQGSAMSGLPLILTVHGLIEEGSADDGVFVKVFDLRAVGHGSLPTFEAGAHIDLAAGDGLIRQYSLLNDPSESHRYVVAIALESEGRGGSRYFHEQVETGATLHASAPRCHFALSEAAGHSVLIAGGIGITPIWSMAQRLIRLGKSFELHYGARSARSAPLLPRITSAMMAANAKLHTRFEHEPGGGFLDIRGIIASAPEGTHFYACGPSGLLDAYLEACSYLPAEQVHYERFAAVHPLASDGGFTVELAKAGLTVEIKAGETILAALLAAGLTPDHSCAEGLCGACETKVIEGIPDHRDDVLSEAEKAGNQTMMICCSGAKTPKLVLDL